MILAPLLVLPVRIVRVLKVPERAAALHSWDAVEVVRGRWRIGGPFESPRIPRIVAGGFTAEIRPDKVSQKDQDPRSLEKNSDGHDQVPRIPTAARFVGVDSSRHAQQAGDMHEVKGQVETDDKKPEMQLAKRLAVHLARHLWEPVVKGPKKTEKNSTDDDIVKMRNHEIGIAKVPVEGGRTLHDPRKTGDQELEKKSNAEQHRSLELNLSSPHGCQPVEDLDAGRNGDGHG